MNRIKIAEVVTIVAGLATVASCLGTMHSPNQQTSANSQGARPESFGVHSIIADELAGKIELTDKQIDELATLKIKSIQNLRPLVHQLCADVRQLKSVKTSSNYNPSTVRNLEQRVLQDREMIIKRDLEDHQTANHILGS